MKSFKKDIYRTASENADPCLTCIPGNVPIGTQVWSGCNLNVTKYRNGVDIPEVSNPVTFANTTTGAWCHYNNDPTNDAIYGKLYNWYAVNDPRGLAPSGWHVPTQTEYLDLISFLKGSPFTSNITPIVGGMMKEMGTCHWFSPNVGATNSSGFTGLAGGTVGSGVYMGMGYSGYFWTASPFTYDGLSSAVVVLSASNDSVSTYGMTNVSGLSVRVVQDYY
jgi:uncharacterized protein (TIGR02145 family)